MKEFNLDLALNGARVVTRGGAEVTQLTALKVRDEVHLVGVVGGQMISNWLSDGAGSTRLSDLFMAPVKQVGWINIYSYGMVSWRLYPTKEEADSCADDDCRVACVMVEWEE